LISARLPSHAVVRELLAEAGAKGLVHEPALTPSVGDEVFIFPAIDLSELNVSQFLLPELRSLISGEDVIFILHSSGSTSGRPKLVPGTARWLNRNIEKARHFTFRPLNAEGQEIITANGSVCHIASMLTFISFVDRSGCMVLPTTIPYPLYELRRMVKECKITILNMFPSFIVGVIREAHKDPELLAMLQSFDACTHGGLPLEEKEGAWAREQGVNLVDTFASTEIGCMMLGIGGREGQFLQVWPESKFELRPISVAQDADSNIADGAYNQKLVELVVPRNAP
ncbi:acetyl- synthetase, partial [Fusarium albosuccineum]